MNYRTVEIDRIGNLRFTRGVWLAVFDEVAWVVVRRLRGEL